MEARESVLKNENDNSRSWHFLALFTAALGLIIAAYGIYHHRLVTALGHTDAFCNINGIFNCDAVATSAYSRFLTIPWAVWGAAFYFTVLVLLTCSFKRFGKRQEHLLAYTICVLSGGLVTGILAYISFNLLKIGCLVCIATYAVNLLQLGLVYRGHKRKYIDFTAVNFKSASTALVSVAIGFAVVLTAYNIIGERGAPKTEIAQPAAHEHDSDSYEKAPVNDIPITYNAFSGLGEDYRKGPDDAKAKIVIFSDFQCPACRNVSDLLEEIYQSNPGKVLVIYRNYPLDQACNGAVRHKMHEHACKLAVMARCAGRYGKFWPFHDIAFAKQSELSDGSEMQWATQVGLSSDQIKSCETDKSIQAKIREDIDIGNKLNIQGTPSVYVNGRLFKGSFQEMKDEVRKIAEF